MTIVCGTDFTEPSTRAITAAAHLARRTEMPLHLVHTLEIVPDDDFGEIWVALRTQAERRLRTTAERLREVAGKIEVHVEVGVPDQALLDVATKVSARLIVLGAAGRRQGKTALGSHADRVAQRSQVPVLVVRDASPFEHWARESKPLRIVLGVDASQSSEAALSWVRDFRALGPCEVTAIQLYWPPEQFHRLGLGGVRSYIDPEPEVARTLEREFNERLGHLSGAGPIRFRSVPHLGRVADHLGQLAYEENADLVVVGSRSRNALERIWEGSVSRGVLRAVERSVVCVPVPASATSRAPVRLRSVLVATDFSKTGDAAIPLAYSVVAPGGTVHLVHVIDTPFDPIAPHDVLLEAPSKGSTELVDAARKRLLERIPGDALAPGRTTHVQVLESHDAAAAICQAAERLGVDLVCLGTHGRSGAAKALLGSVAQEVVRASQRPVVTTRAPLE
jgi:nucleotide-binding universal stress UspA family protein